MLVVVDDHDPAVRQVARGQTDVVQGDGPLVSPVHVNEAKFVVFCEFKLITSALAKIELLGLEGGHEGEDGPTYGVHRRRITVLFPRIPPEDVADHEPLAFAQVSGQNAGGAPVVATYFEDVTDKPHVALKLQTHGEVDIVVEREPALDLLNQ